MWDEEAPTGFQEADLELRELEDQQAAYEADLSPEERNELHRMDDLEEVEEREPYMTAAELRFEADLDEQSSYEDYLGLNDY